MNNSERLRIAASLREVASSLVSASYEQDRKEIDALLGTIDNLKAERNAILHLDFSPNVQYLCVEQGHTFRPVPVQPLVKIKKEDSHKHKFSIAAQDILEWVVRDLNKAYTKVKAVIERMKSEDDMALKADHSPV